MVYLTWVAFSSVLVTLWAHETVLWYCEDILIEYIELEGLVSSNHG